MISHELTRSVSERYVLKIYFCMTLCMIASYWTIMSAREGKPFFCPVPNEPLCSWCQWEQKKCHIFPIEYKRSEKWRFPDGTANSCCLSQSHPPPLLWMQMVHKSSNKSPLVGFLVSLLEKSQLNRRTLTHFKLNASAMQSHFMFNIAWFYFICDVYRIFIPLSLSLSLTNGPWPGSHLCIAFGKRFKWVSENKWKAL